MISQQTDKEIRAIASRLDKSSDPKEKAMAAILIGMLAAAMTPAHFDELVNFNRDFSRRCVKDLKEKFGR